MHRILSSAFLQMKSKWVAKKASNNFKRAVLKHDERLQYPFQRS